MKAIIVLVLFAVGSILSFLGHVGAGVGCIGTGLVVERL